MQKSPEYFNEKQELRKKIKAVIRSFWSSCSENERERFGNELAQQVCSNQIWQDVKNVCVFLSMPDELDTSSLIAEALHCNKCVYVPRIIAEEIEFVQINKDWKEWPRDSWYIPMPPNHLSSVNPEVFIEIPTLIVVPGMAFDKNGHRLGRGKGFYDRYFSKLKDIANHLHKEMPYLMGVGTSLQLVEHVPANYYDMKMDSIVIVNV